jgi:transposase
MKNKRTTKHSHKRSQSPQRRKGQRAPTSVRTELQQLNLDAAGIDIGSEEHYVAVPADRDPDPVRAFGAFTPDLHDMAAWLKQCRITKVAMESTGVYWIPVFQVLQRHGFEVILVNARYAKNVSGRPTDVGDAQWLQQLHTYGLLPASFRPDDPTCVLRSYWRQRADLVQCASRHVLHMQKALTQMNVNLHLAISDITGVTGMRILHEILQGQRDPARLAQLRDPRIRCDRETLIKALTGDYRAEHLFALKQALELYQIYPEKIAECDREMAAHLATMQTKLLPDAPALPPSTKHKTKPRRNEPKFNLREELHRITGVDLTQIDGLDVCSILTVISEIGTDMSRFPTDKNLGSWLGLSPHPQITGGKVVSSKSRKVVNPASNALRMAAQALSHSDSALGAFYRRLRSRIDSPKANTATAYKLARLIHAGIQRGQNYIDQGSQYYDERYRQHILANLARRASQMGCTLVETQTGMILTPRNQQGPVEIQLKTG